MRIILNSTWFIAASLLLFTECSGEKAKKSGRRITRQEFGKAWPLTVEEAYLECEAYAVTVSANGKTYAVNGRAIDQHKHPDLTEIWAIDESYHDPAIRKDIGKLIDEGLKLCK